MPGSGSADRHERSAARPQTFTVATIQKKERGSREEAQRTTHSGSAEATLCMTLYLVGGSQGATGAHHFSVLSKSELRTERLLQMTATTVDIQEGKPPGYNELAKGFGMLKLSNAVAGSFQVSACINRRVISINGNGSSNYFCSPAQRAAEQPRAP